MDVRQSMGMAGPSSYFMQRGLEALGSGSQSGIHGPTNMPFSVPNPNPSFDVQSSGIVGGGSAGSAFQTASPPPISPHELNVGGASMGGSESLKKKRGRPRKYGPDGKASLALSPMPSPPSVSGTAVAGQWGSSSASRAQKRGRGRPPGTGRKQQLASLGEWVSGSAGMGFTPHIISIPVGEDIASRIMSVLQQGPRTVCILSANGAVSTVTLHQPTTSGGMVTYEGRYEILCLSGSYLLVDEGGSLSRTGTLSISLSSPDGRVIGGSVGGLLIAASPVQVVVGSFTHGSRKLKKKVKINQEGAESEQAQGDEHSASPRTLQSQANVTASLMGGWSEDRQADFHSAHHVDIDLMRG